MGIICSTPSEERGTGAEIPSGRSQMNGQNEPPVGLYLDLMKQCLTRLGFHDRFKEVIYRRGSPPRVIMAPFQAVLLMKDYTLSAAQAFSPEAPAERPH